MFFSLARPVRFPSTLTLPFTVTRPVTSEEVANAVESHDTRVGSVRETSCWAQLRLEVVFPRPILASPVLSGEVLA